MMLCGNNLNFASHLELSDSIFLGFDELRDLGFLFFHHGGEFLHQRA